MRETIRVLFIDDDEEDFLIVRYYLEKIKRVNFIIEWARSYEEGLDFLQKDEFDVYLLDYRLGKRNGLDLLEEKNIKNFCKPVIILTGEKNGNVDLKALERGATDYLVKDEISPYILERSIRYAITRKQMEKKLKNEKDLKFLIFNTTSAAICLIDLEKNSIIEANTSFLKMFKIENLEEIKNFNDFLKMKKYEKISFDQNLEEHYCKGLEKCPCVEQPFQVRVSSETGVWLDCIMSCQAIDLTNGKTKKYRLITLIDITKQKKAEAFILKTQENLQSMIKQYGIEIQDPEPILSLTNLQLNKMEKIEEIENGLVN